MQAIGVYLLQWFLSASLAFCVPNGDSFKVAFAGKPRIKVRVTDDFLLVWEIFCICSIPPCPSQRRLRHRLWSGGHDLLR